MKLDERRLKLSADLKPAVNKLLSSRVFRAIESRQADPKSIWTVFNDYRHYCANFPQFLELILVRTNSPIARQPLIDNLWEESGSGDKSKSHVAMLDTFLDSWGRAAGMSSTKTLEPSPAAVSFVDDILKYVKTASLPAVFGFFGPGTEEITSEQYVVLLKGLRSYGLVGEEKLGFFGTHITADIKHADVFWQALENVASSEADWLDVTQGARDSLKRETQFWSEMAGSK